MQLEQLGPYKIGKRLGRGGMGTVFEAVNILTQEPAAVKVLHPALADEMGFRERFEIEIETLKKLRHPQIARLYGFGEQDGVVYYAMELVPGSNLEDELQNGRRFNWRETTQAAIKLCRALKLAHDNGIVHRDLKPANILITPDDDIKLTDFGIARLFGAMNLTSDGGLVGTAEYMSPEQAEGKPVNFQSDLYSLGGVLFAMLAGRPPFRAKSLPEVLQLQRFADPPRVTQLAPDTPGALADLIARLLSKSPAARASNAGLLGREFSAMEHGLSAKSLHNTPAKPPPELDDFSLSRSETLAGELPLPIDPHEATQAGNAATKAAAPRQPMPTDATALYNERTLGSKGENGAAAPPPTPFVAAPQNINRFVTVEEEERSRLKTIRDEERSRTLLQAGVLFVSLAALALVGWWATRPATADKLYAQLTAAAASESGEDLLSSDAAVKDFLERFSDDPRAPEVKRWQNEIELLRLERRFLIRARQVAREEALSPLERDYLNALGTLNSDPQAGYERMRAIVRLYGSLPKPTPGELQCLELARRQMQRWLAAQQEILPHYRFLLESRLAAAREVRLRDPKQAGDICRGVIELYRDRDWAASYVSQAEVLLRELEK